MFVTDIRKEFYEVIANQVIWGLKRNYMLANLNDVRLCAKDI